ncbi:Uncharacterised protein [Mycobacteroides abscessus subsp. abscessus]|nr:Uncharacterised protein [Mycobacteroides abscessus subsp. abscessus]
MDRGDLLEAVLAQGVVRVRVRTHRARTVEGQGRRDVLEVVGLHHPQQRAQAAAVELEDAERVPAGEEFVGAPVVELQVFEIEVEVPVGFDVLDGVGDDREVPQTEEVHLDQPEAL